MDCEHHRVLHVHLHRGAAYCCYYYYDYYYDYDYDYDYDHYHDYDDHNRQHPAAHPRLGRGLLPPHTRSPATPHAYSNDTGWRRCCGNPTMHCGQGFAAVGPPRGPPRPPPRILATVDPHGKLPPLPGGGGHSPLLVTVDPHDTDGGAEASSDSTAAVG